MTMITREAVIAALRHVDDPDLKKDLVTLNMVQDLEISGNIVRFTVMLTTPACPMKDAIQNACINAIHLLVSKEATVEVKMSARVTQDYGLEQQPGLRNVIAVSSGKGGVGKSTIAANLAVALAGMGARVALVDADIYGPSVPILFGIEGQRPRMETVNGKDMIVPFEAYGVKLMSIGSLVAPDQAIVWRGPMVAKALRQLIFDTHWGEVDYLLLDLPPGTGDVHLTLVQSLPVTGAIVVTTPQKLAIADARKGAEMFRVQGINVPLLGVVENMAWFTPDDAPAKRYYLWGQGGGQTLSDALKVPLLGQIPVQEAIAENSDFGRPVAMYHDGALAQPFNALAGEVARQVAIRNAEQPATKRVEIH